MRQLSNKELEYVSGGFNIPDATIAQNALLGGATYSLRNIYAGKPVTGEGFLGSRAGGAVGPLLGLGKAGAALGGAIVGGLAERALTNNPPPAAPQEIEDIFWSN